MIRDSYNSQYTKLDKILISHVVELYEKYQTTKKSFTTNFLNPREIKLVTSYLKKEKIPYSIYEPSPFLEKKVIYFGTYQDFVTIYHIQFQEPITHSQILGTLFSLGLNEDCIGDIIVEKDAFYYTNLSKFNSFLEENLKIINRSLLTLEKVEEIHLEEEHFEKETILVSSMRLDHIVSKITGKSRSQVIMMLSEQMIFWNYEEAKNSSVFLKEGDILSIRRVGKFKIGKIVGSTKKDKMILEIEKYK